MDGRVAVADAQQDVRTVFVNGSFSTGGWIAGAALVAFAGWAAVLAKRSVPEPAPTGPASP